MMTIESVFVDTNVFLYARDDREPSKQKAAARWLSALADRGALVVSPQVLGEFLHVTLRGKLPIMADEAGAVTDRIGPLASRKSASSLRAQRSNPEIRHVRWCRAALDCFAFARNDGGSGANSVGSGPRAFSGNSDRAAPPVVASAAKQHGRTLHGLTILNPFTVGPEAVGATH